MKESLRASCEHTWDDGLTTFILCNHWVVTACACGYLKIEPVDRSQLAYLEDDTIWKLHGTWKTE